MANYFGAKSRLARRSARMTGGPRPRRRVVRFADITRVDRPASIGCGFRTLCPGLTRVEPTRSRAGLQVLADNRRGLMTQRDAGATTAPSEPIDALKEQLFGIYYGAGRGVTYVADSGKVRPYW